MCPRSSLWSSVANAHPVHERPLLQTPGNHTTPIMDDGTVLGAFIIGEGACGLVVV